MHLVFDIASSVEFWRQRYPLNRAPKAAVPLSLIEPTVRRADIRAMAPKWVDGEFLAPTGGVFHVLSTERGSGKRLRSEAVHVWGGRIPEGSFYELQPGVFVESPPFMFLHAASVLGLCELIAFGDELCGRYSFDRREKRGFRKRSIPLVNKERLANYLDQASGCMGVRQATRALRYVVDNAASPMETLDEMTMCLPYRLGGYCLHVPCMNEGVEMTALAARIAGRKNCYLDMGYSWAWLDVEHHGKLDHSSIEDRDSDRNRVNGLRHMGFEVVELTAELIGDLRAYEGVIEDIAVKLGKRIPSSAKGPTAERLALRNAIFAWNASYGRIR